MQSLRPLLLFNETACARCGQCARTCPHGAHSVDGPRHTVQRTKCVGCGQCAKTCPKSFEGVLSSALTLAPREASAEDLYRLARPQLDHLRAITVSGGEPLLQAPALTGFLQLCRGAGINIVVETTLTADERTVAGLDELVDFWLVGLRPLARGTGNPDPDLPDATITDRNLRLIAPHKVIVRYPAIPGYTDDRTVLAAAAGIMEQAGVRRVEVLPYNEQAVHYYRLSGRDYEPGTLKAEDSAGRARDYFEARGLAAVVI
jgi:pyruvate formate lyase activating enzyme